VEDFPLRSRRSKQREEAREREGGREALFFELKGGSGRGQPKWFRDRYEKVGGIKVTT